MHRAIYQNPTFRVGRNSDLNACVGYNGFPNIHTYQLGYYQATIALIENAKKNSYNADALIYPIAFSARHAIELFLKKQLYSLRDIHKIANGAQFESKLESIHSIKELWNEYKELVKIDARYEPYVKNLEGYIDDFYEVDDTGQTFRYPFDIGVEIPLKEPDYRSLKRFIDLFEKYRNKFKTDDFVSVINDFTNAVCRELSPDNIYALAALFDIAYFDLYTESYERIVEEKKKQDVFDLVFDDINVRRGIILKRIQKALSWLGQKSLLKAFE